MHTVPLGPAWNMGIFRAKWNPVLKNQQALPLPLWEQGASVNRTNSETTGSLQLFPCSTSSSSCTEKKDWEKNYGPVVTEGKAERSMRRLCCLKKDQVLLCGHHHLLQHLSHIYHCQGIFAHRHRQQHQQWYHNELTRWDVSHHHQSRVCWRRLYHQLWLYPKPKGSITLALLCACSTPVWCIKILLKQRRLSWSLLTTEPSNNVYSNSNSQYYNTLT